MARTKRDARKRRKLGIRKKLRGTAVQPRLTVYRSLSHIYAQVIDDAAQRTVAQASTLEKAEAAALAGLKKKEKAEQIGKKIAERAKAAGVTRVVFDRNGYKYHGRVFALAKGARENGLEF